MNMAEFFLTIIASLLVSLISVWVSHKISEHREFKRAITLLELELIGNKNLCDNLIDEFKRELELNRQGRAMIAPHPLFSDISWKGAGGIIATKNYKIAQKLRDIYGLITHVNRLIGHLNSMKPGSVASALSNISKIRIHVLENLINFIDETLKTKINEAYQLVTTLKKKS